MAACCGKMFPVPGGHNMSGTWLRRVALSSGGQISHLTAANTWLAECVCVCVGGGGGVHVEYDENYIKLAFRPCGQNIETHNSTSNHVHFLWRLDAVSLFGAV